MLTVSKGVLVVMLFSCLAAMGCGDELEGEEVGCDWISGENCWKASLEAAAACLPPEEAVGTLATDGKACSYAEGYDISFHRPVDMHHLDKQLWDFSLKKNEQLCLTYAEPSPTKRLLTTSLGTYQEEAKNTGVQFTCPDGTKYKVLDARNLLTCENYQWHLPVVLSGWEEDEVAMSLGGNGTHDPLRLFTCRLGG